MSKRTHNTTIASSRIMRSVQLLLLLVSLAFLVLPAIGGETKGTPGGEGGIINVPAIANKTKAFQVQLKDYRSGFALGLPSALNNAVAVYSFNGVTVSWAAHESRIEVAGHQLDLIRSAGVPEFNVTLVIPGGDGAAPTMGPTVTVSFDEIGNGVKITIK